MTDNIGRESRFMPGAWRPEKTERQKEEYKRSTPDQKREMNRRLAREHRSECQEQECANEAVNFPSLGLLGWCLGHDPGFEEGAIAFYENEFGLFPCRIVRRRIRVGDQPRLYQVLTNTGLFADIPAFELLTGWEYDFPDWFEIDWGVVVDWNEEQIVEELLDEDEYPGNKCNSIEDWQSKIDFDYYETLAEKYKA